jgi:hypothetical protein
MTVKELRDWLVDKPDDMRVMVDGYEDGLKDLTPVNCQVGSVVLNYNKGKSCYGYGPHGEVEDHWNDDKERGTWPPIQCVLLKR